MDQETLGQPLKKYTVRMEDGTVYHGVTARSSKEAMDKMTKGPQGPLAPGTEPPTKSLVAQPDIPGREEATAAGNRMVPSALLSMLPIGGTVAGGAITKKLGGGGFLQALGRMTGAFTGGAAEGKAKGGSPVGEGTLSMLTQGVLGEVPGVLGRVGKLARSEKALVSQEDKVAGTVVQRSQSVVPWWQGKFEPTHKGLVRMVQDEGPLLAREGFNKELQKTMPWLKGQTVNLTPEELQSLGIKVDPKWVRHYDYAAKGAKEVDSYEVPLDFAVNKATGQSTKRGVYSKVTHAADQALAEAPVAPEVKNAYQKARSAYAYSKSLEDVMDVPGVIDPVTKRLRLDILSQKVIKNKLLKTAASEGRSPEMRRLLREIAPVTTESPLRQNVGPFASGHVGPMRVGEGLSIKTAKNVPGYGPGPILRATPYVGGAVGQVAKDLAEGEGD